MLSQLLRRLPTKLAFWVQRCGYKRLARRVARRLDVARFPFLQKDSANQANAPSVFCIRCILEFPVEPYHPMVIQ